MKLLFIGDIVGETGVVFLEQQLPLLRREIQPDIVIANAENAAITGPNPNVGCGMTEETTARLLALGIDLLTGGNHSWDGPHAERVLGDSKVLRPLNYSRLAPGRGAAILTCRGVTIGVINLTSRTALPFADHPYDVLERQLALWERQVDHIVVDFHGESVSEKQIFSWSVAGRVSAVLGTHTHVPTLDTQVLGGTAYVSDVGMTGPKGGMQGYDPEIFIKVMRTRLPIQGPAVLASGPVELGAVLVKLGPQGAEGIERIYLD